MWFISVTRLNAAVWKSVTLPAGDFRLISSLDGALLTYDLHTPSNILFRSWSVLCWLLLLSVSACDCFWIYADWNICRDTQCYLSIRKISVWIINSISWTSKHNTRTCVWSFLASRRRCFMSNKKDKIWHSYIFLTDIHNLKKRCVTLNKHEFKVLSTLKS